MATKKQLQRKLLKEIFVNTTGATADRDTDADDVQFNLYSWKISNAVMASRWLKMRSDVVG